MRAAAREDKEAAMPRFSVGSPRRMCARTFAAAGFAVADAERIAHPMVESNLADHDSHGVRRVPVYVQRVRSAGWRGPACRRPAFWRPP